MATITLYRLRGDKRGPRWQLYRPHYDLYPAAWITAHCAEMHGLRQAYGAFFDQHGHAWAIADALAAGKLALTDPWVS